MINDVIEMQNDFHRNEFCYHYSFFHIVVIIIMIIVI